MEPAERAPRPWDGLLQLAFPPCCALTGVPLRHGDLAARARRLLTPDPAEPVCERCAATVGPNLPTHGPCALCRDVPFAFARVRRLGPYVGGLRDACLRIKDVREARLARVLGSRWGEIHRSLLDEEDVAAVTAVPLHWSRRWRRGYNQSAAVADGIARTLQRPTAELLRRTRRTPTQTRLAPSGRRTNVADAFAARVPPRLQDRTILLIDDVLTTGSTCHAAARALRQAGIGRVVVGVLARGGVPRAGPSASEGNP